MTPVKQQEKTEMWFSQIAPNYWEICKIMSDVEKKRAAATALKKPVKGA